MSLSKKLIGNTTFSFLAKLENFFRYGCPLTSFAKEKYSQAIKLIPDYVDAYLNLVSVILEDEVSIVDEMNSLGTSKKDNLRYDELKVKREDLYRECVPLLEELLNVSPTNIDALNTLKNIYGVLGNNEAFMKIKAKIEELQ